ncbi:MAG: hypothetical protein N3G76_01565 [Candidatus Micrarchaeota archaeon]|nr:hypothetical protein [Candidatus Micrarchaeota archaeon]
MAKKSYSTMALRLVRMVNDEICFVLPSGEQVINKKAIKRLKVLSDTWEKLPDSVKAPIRELK